MGAWHGLIIRDLCEVAGHFTQIAYNQIDPSHKKPGMTPDIHQLLIFLAFNLLDGSFEQRSKREKR